MSKQIDSDYSFNDKVLIKILMMSVQSTDIQQHYPENYLTLFYQIEDSEQLGAL